MSVRPEIDGVLEDQNRWWFDGNYRKLTEFYRRRDAFKELWMLLAGSGERATVLVGPRQVGKTTLLLQVADRLLDEGWPPGNLTFFDFSDDRLVQDVSPRAIVEAKPPGLRSDRPRVFLLDEIHEAPQWQRWLKVAVDESRRVAKSVRPIFFATGSSAASLKDGGVESGQGRWDEIPIEGLTYREFLRFSAGRDESIEDALGRDPNIFNRYLLVGGFPEHARPDARDALPRIRQDIIERAILRDLRKTGAEADRVKRLFVYLVNGSGDAWKATARAADLDANRKSVQEWLGLLEGTHLLRLLDQEQPRLGKAAKQLRSQPRIYAVDHGLITALSPVVEPLEDPRTRGRVFEATVFRHLRDVARNVGGRLGYLRRDDDLEIDFVLRQSRGKDVGVEVTGSREVDGRKVDRLVEAADLGDVAGRVIVYSGLTSRVERGVTLIPARDFLIDPDKCLEVAR